MSGLLAENGASYDASGQASCGQLTSASARTWRQLDKRSNQTHYRERPTAASGSVQELTRIVGQIRRRWPRVRIVVRADSGFCRENIMGWCERNQVDYVLGLARNERLQEARSAGNFTKPGSTCRRRTSPPACFATLSIRRWRAGAGRGA